MNQTIEKLVSLAASPAEVWKTITEPQLMKSWMTGTGMDVEITTNWKPGSPITIRDLNHPGFENHGSVLHFEPHKLLSYTCLNSTLQLPDEAENHTTLTFSLKANKKGTQLTLALCNFPTEAILEYMVSYWGPAHEALKGTVAKSIKKHSKRPKAGV